MNNYKSHKTGGIYLARKFFDLELEISHNNNTNAFTLKTQTVVVV